MSGIIERKSHGETVSGAFFYLTFKVITLASLEDVCQLKTYRCTVSLGCILQLDVYHDVLTIVRSSCLLSPLPGWTFIVSLSF